MRLYIKLLLFLLIVTLLFAVIASREYQRFITTPLQVGDQGYTYKVNLGTGLLKISDEMVQKLMSQKGDEHSCDCGHDHAHE